MSIIQAGLSGSVSDNDGTTFRAKKITLRPYNLRGSYRVCSRNTLPVSSSINANRWLFRWFDPTRVCIPTYMRMRFQQTSATATAAILDQRFIMAWLRLDSRANLGGVMGLLSGANQAKKRTSHDKVMVFSINESSTAGGIGTVTGDADGADIFQLQAHMLAAAPTAQPYKVYSVEWQPNMQEHPLVLAAGDTLRVQGPSTAFGAAGTASLLIDISWKEANRY